MYIYNPALVVTMPDDTLEVLGKDVIVQRSIRMEEQIVNGLSIASSRLSMKVKPCQAMKDIIMDNSPTLPCVFYKNFTSLSDRGTVVFTGRLNGGFRYGVSRNGEETFDINVEDESYRLDRSYGESAYLSGTGSEILTALADKVGLEVDDTYTIDAEYERAVNEDDTIASLMESLCMEMGYPFYIRNGVIYLKSLSESTSSATVTDAHMSHFELSREARQYKDVVVNYSTYDTETMVIYNDITGQDSTHDCNIDIPANGVYPSESEAGYEGGGTKVGAVDSANGREIITILSNPTVDMVATSSAVTASITRVGTSGRNLFVKVTNGASSRQSVTRLKASASCRVKVSDSKIRSYSSSEGEMPMEVEAQWCHTKESSEDYLHMLRNYHRFCNYDYEFESDMDLSLGQVVTINDSIFSGAFQTVWVYAKGCSDIGTSDESGLRYSYRAFSISPYETVQSFPESYRTTSGSQSSRGAKGDSVEVQYAIGNSLTEHPTTGWSTTQPTPTSSLPYVWRRERTVTED